MHHCPTCDITDGPIAMGFASGPIVNGNAEAVPVTTCTVCKQPVVVQREEIAVANPLENKDVRDHLVNQRPRSARSPFITGGNILKAARLRVRELNRALKEADAWRRERDDLVRLLKASKEPKAATDNVRRLGSR